MTANLEEFVKPLGPTNSQPHVLSVTTSSVHVDLTGASYTVLKGHIDGGRLIRLKFEGDVWYRWSPNTSADTVDESMAASGGTPANQCSVGFAGETLDESPPRGTRGIVIKAPVACKMRMHASSLNPASWTKVT
jgi:hypothetical protein